MQLYDMHTHILPNFDDGSKSVEESLELLECLKSQGVKNVCLTPHFYTHEMSVEKFINSREEAFEKFKPYMPKDMKIVLGAEVYITQYIFNKSDFSGITYGNSKYILTEFPYNSKFEGKTMDFIDNIVCIHGLTPVLPHIERYYELIDDISKISELKEMGIIIQTNVSNYAKKSPFFKRRKLLKLIQQGYIDIIGTDAHSFERNTPQVYSQAIACIEEKCGKATVERIMKNSEIIFNSALEN